MSLLAKTIIPDQFWVVVDDTGKVGNIDKTTNGYTVKINGSQHCYDSRADVEKEFSIIIDNQPLPQHKVITADYPTDGSEVYNSIIDIKRNLHLFTKTSDSRCYYARGWFAMQDENRYDFVLCPKYIFLQRKDFMGPFYTKAQAEIAVEQQNLSYESYKTIN